MTFDKPLRILSTSGSIHGALRIADLLPFPAQTNVIESTQDFAQQGCFVSHNTASVPASARGRAVVVGLQRVANDLTANNRLVESLQKAPLRAIYTNTGTAAADIRKAGLAAECLYRPGRLTPPSEFQPLPDRRRVLLYWKGDHPPMAAYREAVSNLIKSLPDIEFWTFPDDEPPVNAANVTALGRVRMDEVVPQVHGMVRICDRYDYGRSTFDVLLHGRWVVYNDMPDEMFSYSVPIGEMAEFIQRMVDERSDERGKRQFGEVGAYFSEAALRRRWTDAIAPFFSGDKMLDDSSVAAIERFCTASHRIGDAQVAIDQKTGEVRQTGAAKDFTVRQLPDGSPEDLTTGPALMKGAGVIEFATAGGGKRWNAFVGKSPVGYFMTSPMPAEQFEVCDAVHGYLHPEQALALYHAGVVAKDGDELVEIGAYHGKSTNFLAEGSQDTTATITSVDTFENHAMTEGLQPTFDAFSANVRRFGSRVRPVKGFSHDVVDQTPDQINYLFIDGDHSLKGCVTDIKHYFNRVAEDGFISFDDYYDRSRTKRVKTVVDYFVDIGLLKFITNARSHAVTLKASATCVLHAPKSRSKGEAVHAALNATGQAAFLLSGDVLKGRDDHAHLADGAIHAASYIVAINHFAVPAAVRPKSTLVLLKAATESLLADETKQKALREAPFKDLIIHEDASVDALRRSGVEARSIGLEGYLSELSANQRRAR